MPPGVRFASLTKQRGRTVGVDDSLAAAFAIALLPLPFRLQESAPGRFKEPGTLSAST